MAVLLFVVTAFAISLTAQPVLTSEYFPKLGVIQTMTAIDPGSLPTAFTTGPNQVWNLQDIQAYEGAPATTFEYVDPVITPYADAFGNANVCSLITDTLSYFAYFKVDATRWDYLGVGTDFGPIVFDDPMTMLKPMNFGESFKDTASSTLEYPDFGYYQFITQQVWYRGYGTLKLPQGDFSEVILVESHQEEVDSLTIPSEGYYSIDTIFTTTWTWYKAGVTNSLGTYSVSSARTKTVAPGEEPYYSVSQDEPDAQFDLNVTTGTVEPSGQPIGEMMLFPNPASEAAWLKVESSRNDPKAQVTIFDASGRVVRSQSIALSQGRNEIPLNAIGLQTGLYLVSLASEGQAQGVRMIVK